MTKYLILLITLFAFNIAKAQTIPHPDSLDVLATFPEGEMAFRKHIFSNLRYPRLALRNNIQGTVYVSFIVEEDGTVTNVKTEKGIGGGCDQAAEDVIKLSPKWKPAEIDHKPVRSKMTAPITFKMRVEPTEKRGRK